MKQWNSEADGDNDVKLATKNLVRFRLCPTESCSSTKAAGCSSGYGDYIVSMDSFMDSYFEAVRQNSEYECEQFLANSCDCNEENGDKDDNFNAEYCEYDCFNNAKMTQCIDRNPYEEDEENQQQFDAEEYMECKELNIQQNRRRSRRAEEAADEAEAEEDAGAEEEDQAAEEEEDIQYFVGPYCSYEGGEIFLGVFTDDTCTTAASEGTFTTLMGFSLPYETTSLASAACVTCLEPQENNDGGDDADDTDAVSEACENVYKTSGKCESTLPEGMVASPNDAACNYMDGISIVRKDGIIDVGKSRNSAVATSFIVIFAMSFCAMAFYVWYLRTRLGVKKDTLL